MDVTPMMSSPPMYQHGRIRRRIIQVFLCLYAAATLGCIALVAGPAWNDYVINSNPGRALARVSAVTPTKTVVEYQDMEGVTHLPRGGLLYPSGLAVGQRVWVTYARTQPDLVTVEGRRWTLALIPALSVWILLQGIALIVVVIMYATGRIYRRYRAALPQPHRVTIAPRTT